VKNTGYVEMAKLTKWNVHQIIIAIIVGLAFSIIIGVYASFVDKDTILYLSLGMGICILLLISIFRPGICLLLALISMHNPYYIYLTLTQWWESSSMRVGISTIFILLLFIGILLRGGLQRKIIKVKTPLDTTLIIFLFFPLIGASHGFLRGNSTRLIIADLFPILEFISYFFITTLIIKKREQINLLLGGSLAWLLLTEVGEIIFYFFSSQQFAYKVLLGGLVIHRLNDFMMAIALPFLIALFFNVKSRKKRLLVVLFTVIPLLSLILSFFRSIWTGVIGSLIFILLVCRKSKKKLNALLMVLLVLGVIFFAIEYFTEKVQLFEGRSLLSLTLNRGAMLFEKSSTGGRIEQDKATINEMFESPLIGKGFGDTAISAPSNYYWNIGYKMGLPALVFLFWIVFIFAKTGFRIFYQLPYGILKGWTLGILASFISIAIVVLTFPSLLHFPIPAYLGVGAALLFIIPKFEKIEKEAKSE